MLPSTSVPVLPTSAPHMKTFHPAHHAAGPRWRTLPQPSRRGRCVAARAHTQGAYANKVGVHALVWTGGWQREDIIAAAEGTTACGYDLLEVPAFRARQLDAQLTQQILFERGIQAATSLGLSPEADISSSDRGCAEHGKHDLMEALQFTHAIGGKHMCGPLYSAIAKYPEPASLQGRKHCVNILKEVASAAADLDVRLCLEVINRYETNVINTAAQAMELLSEIDKSNVCIHLDTYHMNIEEDGMEAAVSTCGDKLAYVHIGESHRGYLGSGNVNFDSFFKALAHASYTGPITFESFSSAVVSADLSNTLSIWRNLWQDSRDLAKHARNFIDGRWKTALELN